MLAYGHENGVSVLTPIPRDSQICKNLPSCLQQEWVFQVTNIPLHSLVTHIKFTSKYLVAAHDDNTVTLINHLNNSKERLGTDPLKSHMDEINSIDISDSGIVVTTADDKKVIVWEGEESHVFYLDNVATLVKFWSDKDGDKIIVVENGNTVKVLNYKKNEWLYTIYPLPYSANAQPTINDVLVHNDRIIIVGNGWWKEYDPELLTNGAGYTLPNNESQLGGWLVNSKFISSNSKPLIGGISADRSSFYDLTANSNQMHQFKLQLPSIEVPTGSINHDGVVAFASGSKLLLVKPFDSYEIVKYT